MLEKLKYNWKSGLTVALVSMPLSVSLAVASNATPTIGIITAVWAGLIASLFGGSHYNIVGPTGALSGLIASYVMANGLVSLPMLTLATGCFIFVAYGLKLERYLIFIPSSVIHGFTLGVALIIGFNQMNAALGLTGLERHEHFFANVIESFQHSTELSIPTVLIFCAFLGALFFLRRLMPKIPGALLLSPLGIALGYLASAGTIDLQLATMGSIYNDISFKLFLPLQWHFSSAMLMPAAAIALVAILETMLSAKIADGMTRTKHNERKEMLGLALANIATGLAGGIPATAALARTSLNIKAGAQHKLSASMSAIALVLIAFFCLRYFSYIPMAVIAAILVYVAVQMIEMEHFVKFYRYQRSGFWMSLLVAGITFYEDPIIGIVFGTALALLLFVEKLSRGQFDLKLNTFDEGIIKTVSGDTLKEIKENADILLYSIKGKLAYINSRAHINRFAGDLGKYKIVIIRLRSVYFIDLDGAEALDEIINLIQQKGQTVCLTSLSQSTTSLLEAVSPNYRSLKDRGLIFPKTRVALEHFGIKTQ